MDPTTLPPPAPPALTRYFAFIDSSNVVEVGSFAHIEDAFAAEPKDTIWMFSESCLRDLRSRINELLGD